MKLFDTMPDGRQELRVTDVEGRLESWRVGELDSSTLLRVMEVGCWELEVGV